MVLRSLFLALPLLLMGCEDTSKKSNKPAGTPTDPVAKCEKFGDVCVIDKSRLGVCIQEGTRWTCAPQH